MSPRRPQVQTKLAQRGGHHRIGRIGNQDEYVSVGNRKAALQFSSSFSLKNWTMLDSSFPPRRASRSCLWRRTTARFPGRIRFAKRSCSVFRTGPDVDALDAAAALQNLAEDRVTGFGKDIRDVDKAQPKAQIGPVGAVVSIASAYVIRTKGRASSMPPIANIRRSALRSVRRGTLHR